MNDYDVRVFFIEKKRRSQPGNHTTLKPKIMKATDFVYKKLRKQNIFSVCVYVCHRKMSKRIDRDSSRVMLDGFEMRVKASFNTTRIILHYIQRKTHTKTHVLSS